MIKSVLLIRFWIIDEDTGRKKDSSRWFIYDTENAEINAWFDLFKPKHFLEETKYVKKEL